LHRLTKEEFSNHYLINDHRRRFIGWSMRISGQGMRAELLAGVYRI